MPGLDQDILDWISERSESKPLQAQIVGAKVVKRDYMRTGYFIYYEVAGDAAPVEKSGPLKSPDIMSPELPFGAGTTLFLRDGKLHYLEIYARGGFFPEDIQSYELAMPD
jgi:hypothetical protein